MKRNSSLLILVLSAFSAHASTRVVEGIGVSYSNRSAACSKAANYLYRVIAYGERVVSRTACECDPPESGQWTCTVTGRLEKIEMERNSNNSADDLNSTDGTGANPVPRWETPPLTGTLNGAR